MGILINAANYSQNLQLDVNVLKQEFQKCGSYNIG